MKKLVIDTDVGTDVDDLFALAYALKSHAVNAITIVHGDTIIRAKIARKLERILETEILIKAGAQGNSRYWCGFEHLALLKGEIEEKFKNGPWPSYDSNTTLVCIGPLTNISAQIDEEKSIQKVKEVYFMGSNYNSHNFKVDRGATKKVLAQSWNKLFITKKVSQKISFTRKELSKLRRSKLGDFIYESAMRWLDYSRREKVCVYDVLAVSAAMDEGFVKFKEWKDDLISYDVDSHLKKRILQIIK